MKKSLLIAALAFGVMSASAQDQAIATPRFVDNWSIGVDGGVMSPLKGHSFFQNMRAGWGLHLDKQITPVFGMGVEGQVGINTSTWNGGESNKLAFDNLYVGLYGKVNLFNLFCGYHCKHRYFDIEAVAGAGWGQFIEKSCNGGDYNYFQTAAGLNFNYNATENLTISLKPRVNWIMTGGDWDNTSCAYDAHQAYFQLFASVSYNINPGFTCVRPYDQAEVDALNARIADLQGQLDGCNAACNDWQAKANALAAELAACEARKAVVKEVVTNNNNSVRYVFYKVGSSKITSDQQPNVEMIAAYLKNHPEAKVVIKGYASPEGSLELNQKLAAARAESVKTSLVNKYKIAADRISAEGEGIGHMFEEESWNRVAICTLENAK